MRIVAILFLVFVSACASRPDDGPQLRTGFAFGPGAGNALFVTDLRSLGDINRPTAFQYVSLDAGRFIPARPFTGRRGGSASLITPFDAPAPFTAAVTRPGFVVLASVEPLRAGSPLPQFGRRAPVFELKEGEIGVFSLLTAEVGLEAEGEDPEAVLRAAEEALSSYPNIKGEAKILRPVAFIDFLDEGPGFEQFRIVEDRRGNQRSAP